MKKKQLKIKLLKNVKLLTPFLGLLFVISGVLGLIFIQTPLNKSQETRSKAMEIKSCGESCSSNSNCDINFRCYHGVCRLAANPTNTECKIESSVTDKSDNKNTDSTSNNTKSQNKNEKDGQEKISTQAAPLKKGDNIIPKTKNNYEKVKTINPDLGVNAILDEKVPADETAFDLILKMLKDKRQSLPTAIIIIGISLLAISLTMIIITKLLKNKSKHIDKVQKDTKKTQTPIKN